jgi:ankyrin repeat protein
MADVWTEFVDIGGEAYDRWSAEHAFVVVEHASIPAEFVAIAADEPTDQPSSCSPAENEAEDTAALIAALDAGNWPAVHALVARPGFRGLNARRTADGSTALHCAAFFNLPDIFAAVVAREDFREINAVNDRGSTALHNAAYRGLRGMCNAIMARPDFVAVNARNNCGYTALHSAAARDLSDVCSALVAHAAFSAVGAENIYGATALQMAQRYGHQDVVAVLTR